MRRTMVIGCCGAGKSTFSRTLHSISGLELIHLDLHYWKPDWVETDKADWENTVRELAGRPSWIIDGNYGGTMDVRFNRADTIIYLDYPTWRCLWRVAARVLKHWGRERPDMPAGCRERFDLKFFYYVATFNLTRRKSLMEKLEVLVGRKAVHIFKNDRQANAFLENLKKEKNT